MSQIRARIIEVIDRQIEKGVKKYGQTLDENHDPSYNWDTMALEEMIDCAQYLIKENIRLRHRIAELEMGGS